MTFDKFRYPNAVMYVYRKHAFNHAVDMALKWAKEPVTREEAKRFVEFVRQSPLYQRFNPHDV